MYTIDMGKLEEENRKRVRKTRLQESILLTLASGGRMGSDLIINRALDALLDTELCNYDRKVEVVKSATARLKKNGLIYFENGKYMLTRTGQGVLDGWQMSRYQIKQPRKWDKKWRVIIFDIPEQKKRVREQVREILVAARFQRLQDSVWVYPHDCEDIVGLMKTDLGISKNLLYMIVDQIENDRFLKMDFGLL